ncbi:MAG: hypothetical protein AB8B53_12110 [Flavobacteriales bacterium]
MDRLLLALVIYFSFSCVSLSQIDSSYIESKCYNLIKDCESHHLLNSSVIDSIGISSLQVNVKAYNNIDRDLSSSSITSINVQKPIFYFQNSVIGKFNESGQLTSLDYYSLDSCHSTESIFFPFSGQGISSVFKPYNCIHWGFEPQDSSWTVIKNSNRIFKELTFRSNGRGKKEKKHVLKRKLNSENETIKLIYRRINRSKHIRGFTLSPRKSVTYIKYVSDTLEACKFRGRNIIVERFYNPDGRVTKEIYYDSKKNLSGRIISYEYSKLAIKKTNSNIIGTTSEIKELTLYQLENSIIKRITIFKDSIKYELDFNFQYF